MTTNKKLNEELVLTSCTPDQFLNHELHLCFHLCFHCMCRHGFHPVCLCLPPTRRPLRRDATALLATVARPDPPSLNPTPPHCFLSRYPSFPWFPLVSLFAQGRFRQKKHMAKITKYVLCIGAPLIFCLLRRSTQQNHAQKQIS